MKEVVLKNNSQSTIEVPLCEKVPVVVAKVCKRETLNPGEEIVLGVDVPVDRIRHYQQLSPIDIDLEYRDCESVPETETVTGVRASGGKGAQIIKYVDRNYVIVKFNKATIKIATNPLGDAAYWIGFGVAAPEGAASLMRSFGISQNNLDNLRDPVPADSFDKNAADGKNGWFFYSDLGKDIPPQWARTRWLAEDGTVIEETDYYMDFSELTLEKN